ncbi:hypothetical protein DPMN_190427 [Dreissena polymorpha]|uniref:Uncharacterized protein n=1 Tax=Dreissena polymorpha TaxID=45954 RepID=A0A9D4ID42_DREPO|nr:hypothetical protein DPMN_190427 [Dreissena polymorpha]
MQVALFVPVGQGLIQSHPAGSRVLGLAVGLQVPRGKVTSEIKKETPALSRSNRVRQCMFYTQ